MRAVRAQIHGIELNQERQRLLAADHVASAQGTVAGHGGEDLVKAGLGFVALFVAGQASDHVEQQGLGINLLEQVRHRAQKQGLRAEVLDLESQLAKRSQRRAFAHDRHGLLVDLDGDGKKQALAHDLALAMRLAQALEGHTLVGRVLIHNDQLVPAFADEVRAVNLSNVFQAAEKAGRRGSWRLGHARF